MKILRLNQTDDSLIYVKSDAIESFTRVNGAIVTTLVLQSGAILYISQSPQEIIEMIAGSMNTSSITYRQGQRSE